jgi:hypothetical protein
MPVRRPIIRSTIALAPAAALAALALTAAPSGAAKLPECGGQGLKDLKGKPGQIFVGEGFDDFIRGTSKSDLILGQGGNDVIDAGGGHDIVCGGSGNDFLAGRNGDDSLNGGGSNDRMRGDRGDDIAFGKGGDDRCSAEERRSCDQTDASDLRTPDFPF